MNINKEKKIGKKRENEREKKRDNEREKKKGVIVMWSLFNILVVAAIVILVTNLMGISSGFPGSELINSYGNDNSQDNSNNNRNEELSHTQYLHSMNRIIDADAIVANIWIGDVSRLDRLRENGIKYLLTDIGGTGKDGSIDTPRDEIVRFLEFVSLYESEHDYDFIILPYSEINTYNYNIESHGFKDNFIIDYKEFVEMGFDGIYVDIEPVRFKQRGYYLRLLDDLNRALPENAIIGVYGGSLQDSDNEWEWNLNFYKKVSKRVDILCVPGFDLEINREYKYREYLAEQISLVNSHEWDADFFLGIPTHKNSPETIEISLSVYHDITRKNAAEKGRNNFIGAAVFAEWVMNDQHWDVYGAYNSKKQKNS